jgi:hypothetical protein
MMRKKLTILLGAAALALAASVAASAACSFTAVKKTRPLNGSNANTWSLSFLPSLRSTSLATPYRLFATRTLHRA